MKAALFRLINCEGAFVKKVILLLAILIYGIGSFAQGLDESFSTISGVKPEYSDNSGDDEIVKYEKNLITFAHTLDTGLDNRRALFHHLRLNLPEKYEQAIIEKKEHVRPLYGVGQKYFIDATSSYVVNNYYTSILVKNHLGKDSLIRNTGFEYPLTSLNDVYRYATNKFQNYKDADCKLHITTSGLILNYGLWKPRFSFNESQCQFNYFEDIFMRFNKIGNEKNNLIPYSIESIILFDEPQTPLYYRGHIWPIRRGRNATNDTNIYAKDYYRLSNLIAPIDTVSKMIIQVFTDETASLISTNSKIPIRKDGQQDFTEARIYRYTKVEKKVVKINLNEDRMHPDPDAFKGVDRNIIEGNFENRIPIDVFDLKKIFSRYSDIYEANGGSKNFDTLVDFFYIDNYKYVDSQAIYSKHSCIVYDVMNGARYNLSIPQKKQDKSYQLHFTGVSNGSELPKNLNIKFGNPNPYYEFGNVPKARLEYNCDSNGCEFSSKYKLSLAPLYIYAVLRNK